MKQMTIWCFFSDQPKDLILKNIYELKKEKDEILTPPKGEGSG